MRNKLMEKNNREIVLADADPTKRKHTWMKLISHHSLVKRKSICSRTEKGKKNRKSLKDTTLVLNRQVLFPARRGVNRKRLRSKISMAKITRPPRTTGASPRANNYDNYVQHSRRGKGGKFTSPPVPVPLANRFVRLTSEPSSDSNPPLLNPSIPSFCPPSGSIPLPSTTLHQILPQLQRLEFYT